MKILKLFEFKKVSVIYVYKVEGNGIFKEKEVREMVIDFSVVYIIVED